MFLDIAIDSSGTPGGSSSVEKHRRMLVGSSLGHLFQVEEQISHHFASCMSYQM